MTPSRTDVAQKQKRRRPVIPAFPFVGTARLLANRMKPLFPNQRLNTPIMRPRLDLDLKPPRQPFSRHPRLFPSVIPAFFLCHSRLFPSVIPAFFLCHSRLFLCHSRLFPLSFPPFSFCHSRLFPLSFPPFSSVIPAFPLCHSRLFPLSFPPFSLLSFPPLPSVIPDIFNRESSVFAFVAAPSHGACSLSFPPFSSVIPASPLCHSRHF